MKQLDIYNPRYDRGRALKAEPMRIQNYKLYRENDCRDIPWVRPVEFKQLDLPRPVVIVNGAFDLWHSAHMRLIFSARKGAGTLICALDSDEKIAKEKGPERPILNFVERYTALNYMPLDYIVQINDKRDMNTLMRCARPDYRVQGIEYRDKPSRYPQVKKIFIREGKLHTSKIIDRIVKRYN